MRLGALTLCLLAPVAFSQAVAENSFVGAEKCKMCHNSPAKGAQFTQWAASRHAKAFQTLAGEAAKKFAAAKGIADPQKAPECLKCHVTAHGAAASLLTEKYKAEEGVSCESCHGAGGAYWKMEVMKDRAKSVAAGLEIPTEKTCIRCHNAESPTFKGFDFKAKAAEIAHPNPQRTGAK
jgi:hypothetical protein